MGPSCAVCHRDSLIPAACEYLYENCIQELRSTKKAQSNSLAKIMDSFWGRICVDLFAVANRALNALNGTDMTLNCS